MTRRRGKVDLVQGLIVEALEGCGATVTSLANMGSGCPDLLIGYRGKTYLAECKTGKGKLTEHQEKWFANWRGSPVAILRNEIDAIRLLTEQP